MGRPVMSRASAYASSSALMSWPSTTMACHPKARHFDAYASMSCCRHRRAALAEAIDVGDAARGCRGRGTPRPRPLPTRSLLRSRRRRAARTCGSSEPMRRALSAMPTPAHRPCPSDPVATSTNGRRGVGCPSRSESSSRSFSSSLAREQARRPPTPRRAAAPHAPSTARSDRSARAAGAAGRTASRRRTATPTMSAAEQQVEGWPLPAAVVSAPSRCGAGWRRCGARERA